MGGTVVHVADKVHGGWEDELVFVGLVEVLRYGCCGSSWETVDGLVCC